jgi:hypothetical protein
MKIYTVLMNKSLGNSSFEIQERKRERETAVRIGKDDREVGYQVGTGTTKFAVQKLALLIRIWEF